MTIKPQVYQPTSNLQLSQDVFKTKIKDLYYVSHKRFKDERGFFCELLRLPELEKQLGHEMIIRQVNYSYSKKDVIRGLHAEGWNKLVSVLSGKAFCALVDLRKDSPTYKIVEYFDLEYDLEADAGAMLYVPKGVANSYLVTEGPCGYIYGVDQIYADRDKSGDISLSVFDPELKIAWPIDKEKMIISQRDKDSLTLKQVLEHRKSNGH
jgi:dTDP-4-dehydrorhamnose 3,5-epimerase